MPFLRIWFATKFQRHHPIENIRSRQLVSYPCILLSMIGYTKSVASISNHVKMGSVTCLFWLPLLENRGNQNNCHVTVFCSIPLVFRKSGVLRTVNGAACGCALLSRNLVPGYEVAMSRIAPYFIILLCPMPGEFTGQGKSAGA
jgi:hypothetical protein